MALRQSLKEQDIKFAISVRNKLYEIRKSHIKLAEELEIGETHIRRALRGEHVSPKVQKRILDCLGIDSIEPDKDRYCPDCRLPGQVCRSCKGILVMMCDKCKRRWAIESCKCSECGEPNGFAVQGPCQECYELYLKGEISLSGIRTSRKRHIPA